LNYKVFYLSQKSKMEKQHGHELLRKIALAVAVAGAIVSLIFVIHAGRNNKSIILPLLFVGWVISPFVAFIVAGVARRWTPAAHVLLYYLTIAVAVISPVSYSGILSSPGAKLTPVFLFVPLLAWIVIVVYSLKAAPKARR
jgi:hypothetical protein